MRQRLISFVTAAALGLALTGCTAGAAGPEASTPTMDAGTSVSLEVVENGPAITAAQVSDNYGAEPTVTLPPADQVGDRMERRVIVEGSGPELTAESTVMMKMSVWDFGTGQPSGEYQALPQSITLNGPDLPPYLAPMLSGVKSGSRVAVIVPGAVMIGSTTGAENVAPSLFIVDVKEASPSATAGAAASGDPKPPTQEMVTVSTDSSQPPQVTVTGGTVGKDEQIIDTVIEGTGETVVEGALVTVQYTGLLLDGGTEFDSSWSRGGTPTSFPTNGVVPGFANALVGQKVGSRVVTIFGSDLGYGDAGSPPKIPGGASLVFVVDIIDTF